MRSRRHRSGARLPRRPRASPRLGPIASIQAHASRFARSPEKENPDPPSGESGFFLVERYSESNLQAPRVRVDRRVRIAAVLGDAAGGRTALERATGLDVAIDLVAVRAG